MERLKLLKGGAGGAEMVYFVRLHLLQGVAAFHKGGTNKRHDSFTQCSSFHLALASARRFFQDAEDKMKGKPCHFPPFPIFY